MEIKHERSGHTLTLHFVGELDHHEARRAIDAGERMALLYPDCALLLDLSGLTFMDSSGIAVVLNIQRALGRSGRALEVTGCPKQAMRVFQTAGIDRMIVFQEEKP